MKNDFIAIYAAIEPREQEAFTNYVQCFYSAQKAVLNFFEEVKASLHSDDALEAIRMTSVKDKNKLNAFADLKKWLFEFLAIQEVRSNSTESKFLSLEALRKRGFHTAFQQKSKQMTTELDKLDHPSLWHLFWKLRLSHINYFNLPLDKLQNFHEDMYQLHDNLDTFYSAAKMKYSAELYSRSAIRHEKYDLMLLDEVLTLLNKKKEDSTPSVNHHYFHLLELTKNKSETAYAALKQFLIENPKHDAYDRQTILVYLINFNTQLIGKGEYAVVKEWFDLYNLGLQQSLLTPSGTFSITTYNNILNVACRLREYDWLRRFIKTWSPYLPPQEREEVKNFAFARLAFDEKDFDRVIQLTKTVPYKNYNITLNVRLLNIRAHYELKMPPDALLDHCNALYLYAFRNKHIGKSMKERVINFTKIFRLLINQKPKKMLLKELNNPKKMAICYDWLQEKIDALP